VHHSACVRVAKTAQQLSDQIEGRGDILSLNGTHVLLDGHALDVLHGDEHRRGIDVRKLVDGQRWPGELSRAMARASLRKRPPPAAAAGEWVGCSTFTATIRSSTRSRARYRPHPALAELVEDFEFARVRACATDLPSSTCRFYCSSLIASTRLRRMR